MFVSLLKKPTLWPGIMTHACNSSSRVAEVDVSGVLRSAGLHGHDHFLMLPFNWSFALFSLVFHYLWPALFVAFCCFLFALCFSGSLRFIVGLYIWRLCFVSLWFQLPTGSSLSPSVFGQCLTCPSLLTSTLICCDEKEGVISVFEFVKACFMNPCMMYSREYFICS